MQIAHVLAERERVFRLSALVGCYLDRLTG
jgi:hypothetical protein